MKFVWTNPHKSAHLFASTRSYAFTIGDRRCIHPQKVLLGQSSKLQDPSNNFGKIVRLNKN